VDNLEQQLNQLANTKSDEEASRLRMRLCEVVSDIILTEPQFAQRHDCVGRLWRSCFYAPIGVLRKRKAKEQRKKGPNVGRYETSLANFLKEAITLYEYLITQYKDKLVIASNNSSMSQAQQSQQQSQSQLDDSQKPAASKDPAGVVPGLFRIYIHLGDLHRYDNNYGAAQTAYGKASKLAPGVGNPYNQLAVVAQLKDTAAPLNTVALYWYARSLMTTGEPFEIAKANLARLFQSNRDWFHKQPTPATAAAAAAMACSTGGREIMAKTQRTALSRHFLSQFVDLHFSFFQGIQDKNERITTTATTTSVSTDNALVSDEFVVEQMESILDLFTVLLRASAFGDALLCKMVAICAFSETYLSDTNNTDATAATKNATQWLARTFTMAFGGCLAEQVLQGLAKIQDQPEKTGNPSKSPPPSVRLLLPLLLVAEYIETTPALDMKKPQLSSRAKRFCDKTEVSFWKSIVQVMNVLSDLREPLGLAAATDRDNNWVESTTLKEYKNLIGYAPFQAFLNDNMAVNRQDGYASVEEAADVLELHLSSTQESSNMTQQSSTQDSTVGHAHASSEEYKIKVARFLAFGDRVAEDKNQDGFKRTPGGSYAWKDESANMEIDNEDDDYPMMETENNGENDTQPAVTATATTTTTNGVDGDVLEYKSKEGGPALLVPGALLQKRVLAQSAPASVPSPAPAPSLPLQAPPPRVTAPPPGFGGGGPFGVAPTVGIPTPMPAGFSQGLPPGYYHHHHQQQQQQQQSPTVAQSLHLFGGQDALKTSNPFAVASLNAVTQNHGMDYTDLRAGGVSGSALYGVGNGLFFNNESDAAESSLLGSGLLDSLFDDGSSSKMTKNPFAT